MQTPVPVTFSQEVLPKFRPGDIACMKTKGVKLSDVEWMCDPTAGGGFDDHANARRVYSVLSNGIMPPDSPWPQDWLDTYANWMTGGFQP